MLKFIEMIMDIKNIIWLFPDYFYKKQLKIVNLQYNIFNVKNVKL